MFDILRNLRKNRKRVEWKGYRNIRVKESGELGRELII